MKGDRDEVLSTSDDPWDRKSEDRLSTGQMDALLVELQQLRTRIERPLSRIAALFLRGESGAREVSLRQLTIDVQRARSRRSSRRSTS